MSRSRKFLLSALGALVMAASAPHTLAQQGGAFSFSVGGEYTSGDYGTSRDTDIWYFPFSFRFESDRAGIGLTVPVVRIDGPGYIVPGVSGGGMRSSFSSARDDSEFGVGDLEIRGFVNLAAEDRYGPRMDLTGIIKVGTADRDDRLGTGEDDFAVQLDVERNFANTMLFGSMGYRVMGDPPGVNYDNVFYGRLGVGLRFSDTTRAGVALEAQEAIVPGDPSSLLARFFLSTRSDAKTGVTGYVLRGMRDGSPDWGVGLLVRFDQ